MAASGANQALQPTGGCSGLDNSAASGRLVTINAAVFTNWLRLRLGDQNEAAGGGRAAR